MTTKLEQDFETWWEREGQKFLFALNTTTDDDIKLVAEVAWKNGAYCAEQAEQEPVARVASEHTHSKYESIEVLVDHRLPCNTKLYAAPVQQVDLSDDEIEALFPKPWIELMTIKEFVRAVIAADRKKNK